MNQGIKIFIIGILFTNVVFTQSIYFNKLTTADGLSNNNVLDIIQDKSGFLWFATEDGLNRFDGYDFKIFRHDPKDQNSLSDNSIWALKEDSKGNIWIGTKNGILNCFNPITEKFSKWKISSDEIKENAINCIYEDSEEKIWIGTYRNGLHRLDPISDNMDHFYFDPDDKTSISNNYISSIIEDENGNIWIATYFGLNKLNPNTLPTIFERYFKIEGQHDCLSHNIVWALSRSKIDPNILWIGTADGLTKLDTHTEKFSQIKIDNPHNFQFGTSADYVLDEINQSGERILWINSFAGLVRLNLNNGTMMRFVEDKMYPGSIPSNQIQRMYRDRSGVLWLATDKGLCYLSTKSNKFNPILDSGFNIANLNEIYKKNIKAVTITEDNVIWLGTDEGVFKTSSATNDIIFKKISGSEKLNVWSLTSDHSGNLWIGTYGSGLVKLDKKSNKLENIQMFPERTNTQSPKFNKVVFCDNKNKIWIGYWAFGLACLNPVTLKYQHWLNDPENINSISCEDVWSIYQDTKGRIWIGTDGGGLNLFLDEDGGKFHRWMAGEKGCISNNSIYSICESKHLKNKKDDETILWLGTNNGLEKFLVKNSSEKISILNKPAVEITHYGIEDGLSDNSIRSIIEDNDGNLWIGTSSGISLFNTHQNKFTNFNQADGISGTDINLSSAAINKNGYIFMGSNEGLNYFRPSDIEISHYTPPILITDFQIFNESVKIGEDSPLKQSILFTDEIILSHRQNVFSFQFAAIDYSSPGSIHYAYKMEGFENEWINSEARRFVTYTNLNPGKYTFKVRSTNNDGVWYDNIKTINITITPPWWQTGWAILLYFVVFVAGIFGIIKFQANRTRLQQELKMREFESYHLREIEQMKSRFFANLSHEFRTPLTLIKGPLEQLINGRIKENLPDYYKMLLRNTDKLQTLIDQLLELSQLEAETMPLKVDCHNIVDIVKSCFNNLKPLSEDKNINFVFLSAEESFYSMIDKDKLEKIINNLLSNAFKFTPSGGSIYVNVYNPENNTDQVIISVKDTGIGIPKEFQNKIFDRFYQIDSSSKRSFGGSGIGLALVKELVSLHKWEIRVESSEGEGTEFILTIPIKKSLSEEQDELTTKTDITSAKKVDHLIQQQINVAAEITKEKPSILFVEDNEDVRIYVNDLLKSEYNVLLADLGESGIEITKNDLPDLIISDVMMPGIDGFEFCRRIKSDWKTSHIPVILLTAKVDHKSKLDGLELGADDYITKPFEQKELLIRVKNLIEQRKLLKEKFSKDIAFPSESVIYNAAEKEFIEKASSVVEKYLNDENFNSEILAKEMFMSRSQLTRKMQLIAGFGPGEFIRNYKLNRSAKLILEKKFSITQIALEVGFGSPAQFTRAFQKHFNCLPSDYNTQVSSTNLSL